MFKRSLLLLVSSFLAGTVSGFVEPLPLKEKAATADAIVRGVVVNVIQLAVSTSDSRGASVEKITDKNFSGPNAVAIVRVTDQLKGDFKPDHGIIFVPCGYDFDESPAELTVAKEYMLFLKSMGHNYYHPTTAYSTHRVQMGRVSTSGIDTESYFEPQASPEETLPLEEFMKQVKEALTPAK